jgi:hypothetical protein
MDSSNWPPERAASWGTEIGKVNPTSWFRSIVFALVNHKRRFQSRKIPAPSSWQKVVCLVELYAQSFAVVLRELNAGSVGRPARGKCFLSPRQDHPDEHATTDCAADRQPIQDWKGLVPHSTANGTLRAHPVGRWTQPRFYRD